MSEKYNVIVVGAGPAGLMASVRAAEKGLKVLAVEKKSNVCEQLKTTGNSFRIKNPINGEFVTVETGKDKKARVHFHNSNFDIEYSGKLIPNYDSYSFSNSGYCMRSTRKDRPLTCIYNVETLFEDLKERAERAGASFMPGAYAMTAENTKTGVKLQVKKEGKASWLEADRVISADGLNSRLAETVGLNKDRPLMIRGPVCETAFEGVEFPYPPGMAFVLGKDMLGGRGFLFVYPHAAGENAYAVMVNTRFPATEPLRITEHFTKKSKFAPWFKHAKPIHRTATVVTVRQPAVIPYVGNVLFIGDAAAYGETLVPGAIQCGYHAGDAVYKELSGEKGFEEYKDYWVSNFEFINNPQKQKDYTKILRLYGGLPDDELDFLFKLAEERGTIEQKGEMNAFNEYSGGDALLDLFMSFPEVKGDLLNKLKEIKGADQHFNK
jgi:flavin-dependent dehydrogenase